MTASDLYGLAWTQLWQVTALIVVVALVARLIARRSPHLAYILWLVVLAKCVIPPLVASPSGIFSWTQARRTPPAASTNSGESPQLSADRGASHKSIDPAASPNSNFEANRSESLFAGVSADAVRPVFQADRSTPAATTELPVTSAISPLQGIDLSEGPVPPAVASLGSWMIPLWLAGAAAIATLAIARWRGCLRRVHLAGIVPRADLDALVADLTRRLKLKSPVRLIVTASRIGPAVVGLWRPTILLPAILVDEKSAADLEPILAHELIHIRRRDLWVGIWQVVVQACWWFHPLVWLVNRMATRAAEACCDEEAIAELGCDPERYARSLLEVVALRRRLIPVHSFPGMKPVDVTRTRLEQIMRLGQGCRKQTPWWCWLVLLLAVAVTLPGAAFTTTAGNEPAHPSNDRGDESPRTAADLLPQAALPPQSNADDTPSPDEEQIDQVADAADAEPSQPTPGNSASSAKKALRLNLRRDQKNTDGDFSFLAEAEEMVEAPFPPGAARATRSHIRLRKNVRLWMLDELIKAKCDDGAQIVIEYANDAGTTATSIRVELMGNATWTSSGIEASADTIIATLELNGPDQSQNASPSAVPSGDDSFAPILLRALDRQKSGGGRLSLQGRSRLLTADIIATANAIDVLFSPHSAKETATTAQMTGKQVSRVMLAGQAALARPRNERAPILQAERIEYDLPEGVIHAQGAFASEGTGNFLMLRFGEGPLPALSKYRGGKSLGSGSDPAELITLTYSLGDLVWPAEDQVFNGKRPVDPASSPIIAARLERLREMIENRVAPQTWENASGPGSSMIYRTTLSLVVRQTCAVHEEIADVLTRWRWFSELSGVKVTPLETLLDLKESILSGRLLPDTELATADSVTNLSLDGWPVTDAGLEQLKKLKGLRHLALKRTKITDRTLEHLAGLTNLQSLYLDDTAITDAGLVHLRGLNSLTHLGLSGTKVGDAGMAALGQFPHLWYLSLDRTKVGDAGIRHLKERPRLESLFLRETQVTATGAADLNQASPRLQIHR